MFKKKTSSGKIDRVISQSVNFELTIADLARRSERRAWWVACGSVVLTLILAGGYFYMLPLKQKVPFLVMADAATGVATVASLTDDVAVQRITTSEAINRSNIAHFVLARESYDAAFLSLHDWPTVLTMSDSGVAAAYTSLYSAQNPDNPYKTYGRDKAIRVRILSIVLAGGGAGRTPKGATVRFQRTLYNKQTGSTAPLDNKIATLEFTYKPNLRMDEQARIENPLGFQVTAYRIDNDFESPLPGAVSAASQPAAVASSAETGVTVLPAAPIPETAASASAAASAQTPAASPVAGTHARRNRHARNGAYRP